MLVHGAWHGGWCWRRVADALEAHGHKVFAPTLTGLGERSHLLTPDVNLTTHIQDVANLIAWERLSDIILVGHSYGGFVLTGVAECVGAKIAALAFVDAHVPRNGERVADLSAAPDAIAGAVANGDLTMNAPAAEFFRVNAADRRWVDESLSPHPLASYLEPIAETGARERIVQKAYVRGTGFPAAGFDAALQRCRDQGWRTYELPCGHDIMIDMPGALTDILLEFA